MHLGLIGPLGPDRFVDNISDALGGMGHRVSHLGSTQVRLANRWATRAGELVLTALPEVESRLHRRLVRAALERECDAVLATEGNLAPEAVADLRRERVPVALWFTDAVCHMGRQRMFTAAYSAMFFKEPLLVQRLRDTLDLPAWYLPEACNPRWHLPIGPAGTERVIVVAGNLYPSRMMLVRRLYEAGIPLVVYGAPPARWIRELLPPGLHAGREVFREDKSRVFRAAAGVLNNLHVAEMHGVNCRLFEAAAAGAAVLCERRPALAELFDTEREVVPFSGLDELVDQARHLLGDDGLTAQVGDAATKRAHAEHTYENRLGVLLEKLT